MIPMIVFRNPFLSWVLSSAILYSAVFWAYYSGILTHIYEADFTCIAVGLVGLMVYTNLSLGVMAHHLQQYIFTGATDEETSLYYTQFDVIGYFLITAPSLGLFGTVIGLSRLMETSANVSIENIANLIGTGTGAALYPTGVGVLMLLVIGFQRFLLTHSFRINGFARQL
jgi:hypothetical protein